MTRHRTSAGYQETLENGREYREEQEENTEVSNEEALGWRRRRNVMGKLNEWQTIGLPLFDICTFSACLHGERVTLASRLP